MGLIIKIYLIGVIFNIVVAIYQYLIDRRTLEVDFNRLVMFILASWVVYPLVWIQNRKY